MKNKTSASSTAKLVTLTYYFYLVRKKESELREYQKFYLKYCRKNIALSKIIDYATQLKLGFLLNTFEKLVLPGFINHIGARKSLIETIVSEKLQHRPIQFVILGAGLDPLPLWLATQSPQLQIFEVDHPSTQMSKSKTYSTLPPNLKLTSCDFTKESFLDRLYLQNFNKNTPTLFLWEGVSMYLAEQNVAQCLTLAASAAIRSEILFTFMHQRADKEILFANSGRLTSWILNYFKEPFLWGIPREQLSDFLSENGWALDKLYTEHTTPELLKESETLALAIQHPPHTAF